MKNIFSSSKQNISSLLLWDTPLNEIASITDVRRSNTYEYKRIFKLYSKNFKGGQLSELSSADQRRTLGEIIEVRVDNAVHAVQFINYIIYIPHCPYMSGNLSKNMAWRPQYKSRSLCSRLVIGWGNQTLLFLNQNWTLED